MSVEFTILPEDDVVVITLTGVIGAEQIMSMRSRSMQVLIDTGIQNYYVDLHSLVSLADGKTLELFALGERFAGTKFPYTTRTAVRLPHEPQAREQAEFMHTVELNRGRGAMRYVDSLPEAIAWFQTGG